VVAAMAGLFTFSEHARRLAKVRKRSSEINTNAVIFSRFSISLRRRTRHTGGRARAMAAAMKTRRSRQLNAIDNARLYALQLHQNNRTRTRAPRQQNM